MNREKIRHKTTLRDKCEKSLAPVRFRRSHASDQWLYATRALPAELRDYSER